MGARRVLCVPRARCARRSTRPLTSLSSSFCASSLKVVKVDDKTWSKGMGTVSFLNETSEVKAFGILSGLEKKGVLSGLENAKVLSTLEKSGLTLSKIESMGLLSTAEDLGLLELTENVLTTPKENISALAGLMIIPLTMSFLVLPEGVKTPVGLFFTALTFLILGVSIVVGSVQEE